MRMLFYIAHKTNNTTLKHRPCSSEATRNRPRCPGAAVLPRSYQTMSPAAHVRVGAAVLHEQAVPPFSTAAIIASPPHPNMRQALPRPPIYTKPCNGDLSQRLAEPSKAPLSGCEALKQDDFNVLRKDQCQRHDPKTLQCVPSHQHAKSLTSLPTGDAPGTACARHTHAQPPPSRSKTPENALRHLPSDTSRPGGAEPRARRRQAPKAPKQTLPPAAANDGAKRAWRHPHARAACPTTGTGRAGTDCGAPRLVAQPPAHTQE